MWGIVCQTSPLPFPLPRVGASPFLLLSALQQIFNCCRSSHQLLIFRSEWGFSGGQGTAARRILSLLIFLLCSWVPSLKVGDIGGWVREELPSRASVPMETTAYNLGHLGCASVVSAVSPGICMGVAQCCGLVDELLEDITLPRVLLDVMGPCISSCFHLPCLCSSFLREWVWSRPLGSGSASM